MHAFTWLWGSSMDQEPHVRGPKGGVTGRLPSRIGKKGVTFYLHPDAMKQLRSLGVEEDATLQGLMVAATNLLFRDRGKTGIAR